MKNTLKNVFIYSLIALLITGIIHWFYPQPEKYNIIRFSYISHISLATLSLILRGLLPK